MAVTTEIITVAEVKDLALKTANFDSALIEDYLLPAQRQYIKPYLGKDFYNEMLEQVSGDSSMTSDNSALLNDWIKPALAHFVVNDALPAIRVNITSTGVMVNTSETSQSASSGDASMLRQSNIAMGERWLKHATDFIAEEQEDDSTKFPLFSCGGSNKGNKSMFIL